MGKLKKLALKKVVVATIGGDEMSRLWGRDDTYLPPDGTIVATKTGYCDTCIKSCMTCPEYTCGCPPDTDNTCFSVCIPEWCQSVGCPPNTVAFC